MDRKIVFGQKSYQYPNSNSLLFGIIVKKLLEVFHEDIAVLAGHEKFFFFIWPFLGPIATSPTRYGLTILPTPEIVDGTFVRWCTALKRPISCFAPTSCKNGVKCILPKSNIFGPI